MLRTLGPYRRGKLACVNGVFSGLAWKYFHWKCAALRGRPNRISRLIYRAVSAAGVQRNGPGNSGAIQIVFARHSKAYALNAKAYVLDTKAYALTDSQYQIDIPRYLTALAVTAIETRLATVEQNQRLGIALAAQHCTGREGAGGIVGLRVGLA